MASFEEIRTALSYIPSDDREDWYRMASAVRSELGDTGWELWDDWSRTSEKYSALDARATWRSASGRVGIGSLFFLARRYGYRSDSEYKIPTVRPVRPPAADLGRSELQAKAARTAQDMISRARLENHPYLARKGFPDREDLVLDGELLVPMRRNSIVNVQRIQADGNKRFLYGGLASKSA